MKTDLLKGYNFADATTPDLAAQYIIDRIGVVEETSISLFQDFSFYCLVPPVFFIHHSLWNYIQEKVYLPSSKELAKTNDR